VTTASPTRPLPARAAAALGHRWPTLLGLAWAVVSLADFDGGLEYATVLAVAAVGYLAVAVLGRPAATWYVLAAVLAVVVALRVAGIDPWPVLAGGGAALALVGLARGSLRRPGLAAWQAPAMVVFVGVSLVALQVDPDIGAFVVAGGLLGHAAWDVVHRRAGEIVQRSLAEWCAALDLALAVGILVLR